MFWGDTVITNLLSTIPYLGRDITQQLWEGFVVSGPTLTRFFVFHFIFPFILVVLAIVHIILLHEKGSNNPLGLNSNQDKVSFYPYFITKDLVGFLVFVTFFILLIRVSPNLLGDPKILMKLIFWTLLLTFNQNGIIYSPTLSCVPSPTN